MLWPIRMQCLMNTLYCTESLSSEESLDQDSRQDMVSKLSEIRGALQNMELQRERFMAALHEYEVQEPHWQHCVVYIFQPK